MLGRLCPTFKDWSSGDDPADKHFRLKFYEAIALLKRRGLLMDVIGSGINAPWETWLTSVGQESDFHDGILILIDAPQQIVNAIKMEVPNLDPVVEQYYLESLRACQEDINISSVICLGAASERAINCLAEAVKQHAPQYQSDIDNCNSIAPLVRVLLDKSKNIINQVFIPLADRGFASQLKDKLEGIARIYRINRNEAGHPTTIQNWNREEQQGNLSQFRAYVKTIFKAIDYIT